MLGRNIFIVFISLSLILVCDGAHKKLRLYKVCNGALCKSVRSFISPEFLFDIDSFLYTPWSRWSPCSRRCVTYRYRACRFPSICGDRMTIHEEAFCFRRGTHCEQIFQSNRNDFVPDDSDEVTGPDWGYDTNDRSAESSDSEQVTFPTTVSSHQPRPEGAQRNRRKYVLGNAAKAPASRNSSPQGEFGTSDPYLNGGNKFNPRRSYNVSRQSENEDTLQCGIARLKENEEPESRLRILGGKEAQKGRWPWQVAVLNRMQEAFCGGTLIAPRWILTAAHCVRRRIHVTIGEHHLHKNEGTEKHYRIDSAFIHPDFDPETVNNDIALLLLPEPVSVQSGLACLPEQRQHLPAPDTLCTILGWGKERHNHIFGTTVLHEGKVPIVNNAECRFTYPYELTSNMFCAGYKGGLVDSCAGDSGGPILCSINSRWTIFGVTSFGDGCGRKGKYGIYAKVTNYVEWIHKVMQANENYGNRN